MHKEKAVVLTLVSLLFLSLMLTWMPIARAQTTLIRFYPDSPIDIYNVGETVSVACVVEDVSNLMGIDVQMSWDTTYLAYNSHTATIPVEDYPGVQSPSPYGGIIHEPELIVKDEVNPTAGTYWGAFSSLGTDSFNGSGTIFTMSFTVIYIPWDFEIAPETYVDTLLHFTSTTLASDIEPFDMPHTVEDGVVRLYAREFEYPPWPLLKVMPETISGLDVGVNFGVDVMLMGDGHVDLDPFWDVHGFDILMHFSNAHVEAKDVTIDPDGWFASFWPDGILKVAEKINNEAGTVMIAFAGIPGTQGHTAPFGQGRIFSVTFQTLIGFPYYPPIQSQIYLKNPDIYVGTMHLHSNVGLIDITDPICTTWNELSPSLGGGPYHLYGWTDNGDGELSPCDAIKLNNTSTGYYFGYHVDDMTVTLNLTQQSVPAVDDYLWIASWGPDNIDNNGLPGYVVENNNPSIYNGYGLPYWTGNFTPTHPLESVNQIDCTCLPFGPGEYTVTLTEGVDYKAYPDEDLIEILTPVDVPIVNEYWVDGVNNSLTGWPWINYPASAIQSVYVKFPNGTERVARNNGYAAGPPGEWWFDPDWTWELEGWWALGYFPGPQKWPAGTEWWINYTAASYLTIDYNADPDPNPGYAEFEGTYDDALAALNAPVCTYWHEVTPLSTRVYHVYDWIDSDTSGDVTYCDYLMMESAEGKATYHVEGVATGLTVTMKPWICSRDPSCPFYGAERIVDLVGFPHPDREMCPWHGKSYAMTLPHKVENATLRSATRFFPKISIEPPIVHARGNRFTIDVVISNVTDLYGFDFKLLYNTTLLDAMKLDVGDFLEDPTQVFKDEINDTAGSVRLVVSRLGFIPGVNGTGKLATIEFNATYTDALKPMYNQTIQSFLEFNKTMLSDRYAEPIVHNVTDGIIEYTINIPGDIYGNGEVDIYDIVKMCGAYDSQPGDKNWDERCDLDSNGVIDIYDVVYMCARYGMSI
jgi:hypothetical protein